MNIHFISLHVIPTMAIGFTNISQWFWVCSGKSTHFLSACVWPKGCFYSTPPENLQLKTTQCLEDSLVFVPCETPLEWHSYTWALGMMGHILLVVLAFAAFAPALCLGSSHLHVAMTPHLCNTTKQLPCAQWQCDMDYGAKQLCPAFTSVDLFWHCSSLIPVKTQKLSRQLEDWIERPHGGCILVMSKDVPGSSCLCTRLPLHVAGMSLAAAQNCSWAMWEASSA